MLLRSYCLAMGAVLGCAVLASPVYAKILIKPDSSKSRSISRVKSKVSKTYRIGATSRSKKNRLLKKKSRRLRSSVSLKKTKSSLVRKSIKSLSKDKLIRMYARCIVECSPNEFRKVHNALIEIYKKSDRSSSKNKFYGTPTISKTFLDTLFETPNVVSGLLYTQTARAHHTNRPICFFGGWPSRVRGNRCERPWLHRGDPELRSQFTTYDRNHYCGPRNQFRCNPLLFGGGPSGKGICITITSFRGLTEKCQEASQSIGYETRLQERLRSDSSFHQEYQKLVMAAGNFCSGNRSYDACQVIRNKVTSYESRTQDRGIASVPELDTEIAPIDLSPGDPTVDEEPVPEIGVTEPLTRGRSKDVPDLTERPEVQGPVTGDAEIREAERAPRVIEGVPFVPRPVVRPRARPDRSGEEIGDSSPVPIAGEVHMERENEDLADKEQLALENFKSLNGDETAFMQLNCFRKRYKDTVFSISENAGGYGGGVKFNNECKHIINQQTSTSNYRRLYVVDFCTGEVEVMATGGSMGCARRNAQGKCVQVLDGHEITRHFGNTNRSNRMPSGFHVTGQLHLSRANPRKAWHHGIKLHGVERGINDNSYDRGIIIHRGRNRSGDYISSDDRVTQATQNRRLGSFMGRAHGCVTVGGDNFNYMKEILGASGFENLTAAERRSGDYPIAPRPIKGGSIVYNYTPREKEEGPNYCGTNVMSK